MKKSSRIAAVLCILSVLLAVYVFPVRAAEEQKPIKWVDFTLTAPLLRAAAAHDIKTHGTARHINWIDLLALVATRCGGQCKTVSMKSLDALAQRFLDGEEFADMTESKTLYAYYQRAYTAVLGGMLGPYRLTRRSGGGEAETEEAYGIRVYAPIGKGFYFSHSDDFGAARSYGYKRSHLGHDLMGSVGTPVVAVESGYVEACGWNQYGGWRIGIRSFDGKRYYYYAHLRKGHPYNDLYEGKVVAAGEVIGYMGMTGYSAKEDVNNIQVPHLHFGLELIFDKAQKDGWNQIWIDLYQLTLFLDGYRSSVSKIEGVWQADSWKEPTDFWD